MIKGETTRIQDVSGDFCAKCGEVVLDAQKSARVNTAMLEFNKRVNAQCNDPVNFCSGIIPLTIGDTDEQAGCPAGQGRELIDRVQRELKEDGYKASVFPAERLAGTQAGYWTQAAHSSLAIRGAAAERTLVY